MSDLSSSSGTRRHFLKGATTLAGGVLATPFLSRRAFAQPVELTMLAWYGHAEPDVVAAFEAEHNVKFKPKYYTGGDNMLGLISQSPPGTFDLILSGDDHSYATSYDGVTAYVETSIDGQFLSPVDLNVTVEEKDGERDVSWFPTFRFIDTAAVVPDPESQALADQWGVG